MLKINDTFFLNRKKTLSLKGVFALAFFCFLLSTQTLMASFSVIRDAEIETFLKDIVRQLYTAAGLDASKIKIYVVNDDSLNAMATINGDIIVYTGLITRTKHVGELVGVLAHETSHIVGKHPVHKFYAMQASQAPLMATMALGLLGGVAAGRPDIGAGIAMGVSEMGQRNFLHYNRGQESMADLGATQILDKLGYPSAPVVNLFRRMESQSIMSTMDPYLLSHPLHNERIAFFQKHAQHSPHRDKSYPQKWEEAYKRSQVKIVAFMDTPGNVQRQLSQSENNQISSYGKTIILHRQGKVQEALQQVDQLLTQSPNDPYFLELKATTLYEKGRFQEAAEVFKKAITQLPTASIYKILLAQCYIALENYPAALSELNKVEEEEGETPMFWRLLATAYGRNGQEGLAALALSEYEFRRGENKERAIKTAQRALAQLPATNTQARQRAKDILLELEGEEPTQS